METESEDPLELEKKDKTGQILDSTHQNEVRCLRSIGGRYSIRIGAAGAAVVSGEQMLGELAIEDLDLAIAPSIEAEDRESTQSQSCIICGRRECTQEQCTKHFLEI